MADSKESPKGDEPKSRLIFVPAYRNRYTGKLMRASDYGLKAWAFEVKDTDKKSEE